ncbi:protein amnionless [Galleria mellonella]|uniref:Protein amnionless n=1 Tax=Galleria mellonella TaxID=7137 RepID=A0A6J1WS93_GALME|nr:protein amnionless [Galleria mellonella]
MWETYILLVSIFILPTTLSIVKWLPNRSFNLPVNFLNGKLPCSRQTVVFPENIIESVRLESEISVSEFVLPSEGEITLANGVISFGADPNDSNCTDDGNVYYLDNSVTSWAQPDMWSSTKFNDATPDAERIPCYDDIVEFPQNAQFTIILPDDNQIVKEIRIGKSANITTTDAFSNYVSMQKDQSQQFILNKFQQSGVNVMKTSCKSRSGCPCQKFGINVDCSAKFCPVPTCDNPIQPIGHCCKICGGYITFAVDRSFDMMSFKEFVAKIVHDYGSDNILWHISRLPQVLKREEYTDLVLDNDNDFGADGQVQVVVVDKREYTGDSAQVTNEIQYRIKGLKTAAISGSPLSKSGINGKIAVSMFFTVILVMGAVYVYYYRVPEHWVENLNLNRPRRVISRFQRRTESVVSLTRRDSGTPIGTSINTGFRNPMYDSKRGRVHVVEPVDIVEEE